MNIKYFESITSTNEVARDINKPWTVIVAREQMGGHGKGDAHWYSPEGGLYFSIILPKTDLKKLETVTILTAFIISKIIKEQFNIEPFIKLPNDIYINNKKVCGILTQNVVQKEVKHSVIGIGLNTNIDKFPSELNATSLKLETKKEIDNESILNLVIKELKKQFK